MAGTTSTWGARMTSPKVLQFVVVSAVIVILLLFLALGSDKIHQLPIPLPFGSDPSSATADVRTSRFHLLIVATAANLNFCRLFFSSAILSYPQPVLIDWEGTGRFNASDTHLAKITGTLRYLQNLPPHKDDDIVLVLDGYDIVLQLPPEVMLQRYFEAIDGSNGRLRNQLGATYVRSQGLYNSILFGPDKTCWPADPRRPACWAVPESPFAKDAFGPETDTTNDNSRPRWLNSGTIMGPAGEIRDFMWESLRKINKTWDPELIIRTSDQMYLSDLWADQEYARMLGRYGVPGAPKATALPTVPMPEGFQHGEEIKGEVMVPDVKPGHETEFHVTLDYKSELFQTAAFYLDYITWGTFNMSVRYFDSEQIHHRALSINKEVKEARAPFIAIRDDPKLSGKTWRDVSLATNVITGLQVPLMHYTGDKTLRDSGWLKMWYFPYAERLLSATQAFKESLLIGEGKPIAGFRWEKDQPYEKMEEVGIAAWSDLGERLPWDGLCKKHENWLFSGRHKPYPPPPPPPPPDWVPPPPEQITTQKEPPAPP